MPSYTTEELAQKFVTALKTDISLLKEICAPGCRLWHSNDNKWMAQGPALDAFIQAQKAGTIPSFGEVSIMPTAKGFLAQTSITLAPIGKMHVAQLMTVEGGKIVALEEYIAPEMNIAAQLAN